ncbi:probable serine racemase isoform X2 [Paramacrobiotus metropolitanus]|uniref:probable serine racemase isoform X2 n=1 Tax=Paramacrobiotus metropolitanus TaxID=2943436 RepID=UPI00244605CE|nr:probable serine racemase isoform X2 [Paramacrobiotus metropolitanus]
MLCCCKLCLRNLKKLFDFRLSREILKMGSSENLSLDDLFNEVLRAEKRIRPHFPNKTPVITNEDADAISGKQIYFKCENLQKTGAFKARGALNAILAHLEKDPKLSGVVTHSSGNHGQALAWAAKRCGIACTVVVPEGTPSAKIGLIKKYGAECVVCPPTPTARKETCARIAKEENKVEVPPYDDLLVIAGQGTIGLELLEQVPDVDMVIMPISGGGMTSGVSIAFAKMHPTTQVCPVEPVGKDLQRCLSSGQRLWPNPPQFLPTLAEGIRMQQPGDITFPLMCQYTAHTVFTVTDAEMVAGMKWAWQNLKLVIEVSAAAGVAVVLSESFRSVPGHKVAVVLSGGNCTVDTLLWA